MSNRRRTTRIERAGTDERAFTEVFDLLLALHKEGGYAPLDAGRAAENCYRVMSEGRCFVARLGDEVIGTIAMVEMPFWYSGHTFLQDAWVYVKPKHRKKTVGVKLMRAVREDAEASGKIAFVTVNNPDRRPKATTMSLFSQTAGYVPLGYTMKVA